MYIWSSLFTCCSPPVVTTPKSRVWWRRPSLLVIATLTQLTVIKMKLMWARHWNPRWTRALSNDRTCSSSVRWGQYRPQKRHFCSHEKTAWMPLFRSFSRAEHTSIRFGVSCCAISDSFHSCGALITLLRTSPPVWISLSLTCSWIIWIFTLYISQWASRYIYYSMHP